MHSLNQWQHKSLKIHTLPVRWPFFLSILMLTILNNKQISQTLPFLTWLRPAPLRELNWWVRLECRWRVHSLWSQPMMALQLSPYVLNVCAPGSRLPPMGPCREPLLVLLPHGDRRPAFSSYIIMEFSPTTTHQSFGNTNSLIKSWLKTVKN